MTSKIPSFLFDAKFKFSLNSTPIHYNKSNNELSDKSGPVASFSIISEVLNNLFKDDICIETSQCELFKENINQINAKIEAHNNKLKTESRIINLIIATCNKIFSFFGSDKFSHIEQIHFNIVYQIDKISSRNQQTLWTALLELIDKSKEEIKIDEKTISELIDKNNPMGKNDLVLTIKKLITDVFIKEQIYKEVGTEKLAIWETFIENVANSQKTPNMTEGLINRNGLKIAVKNFKMRMKKQHQFDNITLCSCMSHFNDILSTLKLDENSQQTFFIPFMLHVGVVHVRIQDKQATVIFSDSMGSQGLYSEIFTICLNQAKFDKKNFKFILTNEKLQIDGKSCLSFAWDQAKQFIKKPELFDVINNKAQLVNSEHHIYSADIPLDLVTPTQDSDVITRVFIKHLDHKLKDLLGEKIKKYTRFVKGEDRNVYAVAHWFKRISEIALERLEKGLEA